MFVTSESTAVLVLHASKDAFVSVDPDHYVVRVVLFDPESKGIVPNIRGEAWAITVSRFSLADAMEYAEDQCLFHGIQRAFAG